MTCLSTCEQVLHQKCESAGALTPVNHKGLYQGWKQISILAAVITDREEQRQQLHNCLVITINDFCANAWTGFTSEEWVSWCFEPSQPQRIISGLKTNFDLGSSGNRPRRTAATTSQLSSDKQLQKTLMSTLEHALQSEKLVRPLMFWAQSTTKDYIRAKNKFQSIS